MFTVNSHLFKKHLCHYMLFWKLSCILEYLTVILFYYYYGDFNVVTEQSM